MGYIIIIVVALQFLYLLKTGVFVPQAAAGSMSYHFGIAPRKNLGKVSCKGMFINVEDMEQIKVNGDSMEKYGISDGDYILLYRYNGGEIKKGSIIAHKIHSWKPLDAPYKLRKYVCMVNNLTTCEWKNIYETNKDIIGCDYDEFENCITQRVETLKAKNRNLNEEHALSITFADGKIKCSLHRKKTIYGIVQYVI